MFEAAPRVRFTVERGFSCIISSARGGTRNSERSSPATLILSAITVHIVPEGLSISPVLVPRGVPICKMTHPEDDKLAHLHGLPSGSDSGATFLFALVLSILVLFVLVSETFLPVGSGGRNDGLERICRTQPGLARLGFEDHADGRPALRISAFRAAGKGIWRTGVGPPVSPPKANEADAQAEHCKYM